MIMIAPYFFFVFGADLADHGSNICREQLSRAVHGACALERLSLQAFNFFFFFKLASICFLTLVCLAMFRENSDDVIFQLHQASPIYIYIYIL